MKKWKLEDTITILLLILVAMLIYFTGYMDKPDECKDYKSYVIMQHDTLWNIAKKQDSDKSIQEIVYKIRQDNGIKDCGSLKVGQEIKLREVY